LALKVRMVFEMCKEAKGANDEMVARAFPVMSKLFQRCAAAPTLSTASTGVLLLVGPQYISIEWVQCFWKLEYLLW
jgi:AP-5 complex subunit zeta-1